MIELKDVLYKKGDFLLNTIHHIFKENKIHAILGPSGSGKTILLELITGLIKPQKGKIYFKDQDITKLSPQNRQIAYLPQDNVLFPHLSVMENILFPLNITKSQSNFNVSEIIEKLQIKHLINRSIHNLSGGEIQRIALARSIVAGKKVLLLDEPTASIHHVLKNEFLFFLKDIQKEYELTIIMVTHDIDAAFSVADEINFLIYGNWYPTHENGLFNFIPTHYEIARFMGIKNILEGYYSDKYSIFCPALNTNLLLNTASSPFDNNKNLYFAIKPEDIRIVLPDKFKEYQNVPNKLSCVVKKIYRQYHYYNLQVNPINTGVKLEVLFPITKTSKINLSENSEIEIVLKPEYLFILS
ncbi:MAG: spermidine/putrescine import ATP-binding protein PotA [Bacteroidia bacterium]|nr:MAG: spermidine/putrescine import ATP-binding protein PotA [Bacteroidia bacterium]